MQISGMNAESTYESVGPSEIVYERKNNNTLKASLSIGENFDSSESNFFKKLVSFRRTAIAASVAATT